MIARLGNRSGVLVLNQVVDFLHVALVQPGQEVVQPLAVTTANLCYFLVVRPVQYRPLVVVVLAKNDNVDEAARAK